MVLIIDNYDSFVYNLARYVVELGHTASVKRHDAITLAAIEQQTPEAIIISPGPCAPDQAGISLDVVHRFAGRIPLLGVCLGHQAIGQAFGAQVVRSSHPRHGKTSTVFHQGRDLFETIPSPFKATRYHSLSLSPGQWPNQSLTITAYAEDGEIMALSHRQWRVYGVQFHPESILTEHGQTLLAQFLKRATSDCYANQ